MPKTSCTFLTVKVCSEVQQDKSLKVEKAALHEGMFVSLWVFNYNSRAGSSSYSHTVKNMMILMSLKQVTGN